MANRGVYSGRMQGENLGGPAKCMDKLLKALEGIRIQAEGKVRTLS